MLISVDFESGNTGQWSAGLGPGAWALLPDPSLVGNTVYRQTDAIASRTITFAGSAEWRDVAIEAKVRVESGDMAEVYLATRVQGPFDFYYLYMRRNGKFRLRKFVANSTVELGAAAIDIGQVIDTGVWYTLRFEVFASTLSMYFENTLVGSVTDTDFALGSVGMGAQDGVVSFDDVIVTQL